METSLRHDVPFAGRLIRVEVHKVRLGHGGEGVREVVRHPGAVVVLPLLPDGKLVLVRQFRFAVGEALWELPAGTLRTGETPLACAQRELAEETGFRGHFVPLGSFYSAPGFCDEKLHCFLARDLQSGEAQWDEDEELEVASFTAEEIVSAVKASAIRDAKSLACFFLANIHGFLQLEVPWEGSKNAYR